MTLSLPITQLSFITISIQKHLLKIFPLQDREMKVYTISFLNISATSSSVASISNIEISPVSSSSSSPGKLSVLSKQTLYIL